MLTDIEIAQKAEMADIREVAAKIGATEDDIEMYGKYMAKMSDGFLNKIKDNKDGKLILVTAINPTPAGEGKEGRSSPRRDLAECLEHSFVMRHALLLVTADGSQHTLIIPGYDLLKIGKISGI